MKYSILLPLLIIVACKNNEPTQTTVGGDATNTVMDTLQVEEAVPGATVPKTYSNARFREVTVERIGQDTFLIRGQGQIFEANFNWVVEDGHYELAEGFQMTDAGAPAWGKFEFPIIVRKERENSSLTLILFESSAKDGSRQYELPIPLH